MTTTVIIPLHDDTMDNMGISQWIANFCESNELHEAVARFIIQNSYLLDPPINREEDRTYPTRQGWIAVSDLLKQVEATDSVVLTHQFSDLISREVGVMFFKFVSEQFKGIDSRWE